MSILDVNKKVNISCNLYGLIDRTSNTSSQCAIVTNASASLTTSVVLVPPVWITLSGIAILCYVVLKLAYQYYKWRTSPIRNIAGPTQTGFWLGTSVEIFTEPFCVPYRRWLKRLQLESEPDWNISVPQSIMKDEKEDDSSRKLNEVPVMAHSLLMGTYCVAIFDADIVQEVLCDPTAGKENTRYAKQLESLKYLTGEGLLTNNSVDWSRHRRIIQPCFQTSFLQKSLDEAVPEITWKLINIWKASNDNGTKIIDVDSHLQALTLDIIGRAGFSYEFNGLDALDQWTSEQQDENMLMMKSKNLSKKEWNKLMDKVGLIQHKLPILQALRNQFVNLQSIVNLILYGLGCQWLLPYLKPAIAYEENRINNLTNIIVKEAKEKLDNMQNNADRGNKETLSLLQLMLKAANIPNPDSETSSRNDKNDSKNKSKKRNELEMIEIRDEVKTFLISGFETTATLCSWALYVLSQNPDVQEKFYQDIAQHAKEGKQYIGLEEVEKMDYVQAFMNEVLRLYPPIGVIVRSNTQDVEWQKGKYLVPKNTRIVIPIHLINRDPKYWGLDAEEFRPERWLEGHQRHPFSFLSFSAGNRGCIGYRFARMEATMIIASIAREFEIKIPRCVMNQQKNGNNTKLVLKYVVKPDPLIKICVKERNK